MNRLAQTRPVRRVLCIAYFYPPSGGAGVQRPLKFTKYLPSFGWQPHVLTVSDGCFFAEDPSLNAEIGSTCTVHRAWSLEIERLAALRRHRKRQSQPLTQDHGAQTKQPQKLGALLRFGRTLLLPDPQIGWVPFAYRQARAICRTQRIDAVWSSSAPYSCHLIGLLLKRRLNLPWIADFRDAWSDDPMDILAHHKVHRWLEHRVLKHADRIVGVTQDIVRYLAERTDGPKNKYHLIANGYDPQDFLPATARPKSTAAKPSFVLTMTGSLYAKISAVPFYAGLAQFFDAHPAARAQTQIRWVGQMDHQARTDSLNALERFNIRDCITHVGYLPHRAAIEEMMAADVLLLLLFAGAGASQVMTGKVFEYLATQKPILAMAQGTAAAKLIESCKAGLVTHPNDSVGIAQALGQLWQTRHQRWPLSPARQAILEPYSRRALTAQLAQLLDGLTR